MPVDLLNCSVLNSDISYLFPFASTSLYNCSDNPHFVINIQKTLYGNAIQSVMYVKYDFAGTLSGMYHAVQNHLQTHGLRPCSIIMYAIAFEIGKPFLSGGFIKLYHNLYKINSFNTVPPRKPPGRGPAGLLQHALL